MNAEGRLTASCAVLIEQRRLWEHCQSSPLRRAGFLCLGWQEAKQSDSHAAGNSPANRTSSC